MQMTKKEQEKLMMKALRTKKGMKLFADALLRPIVKDPKRSLIKNYTDWIKPAKQRKFRV